MQEQGVSECCTLGRHGGQHLVDQCTAWTDITAVERCTWLRPPGRLLLRYACWQCPGTRRDAASAPAGRCLFPGCETASAAAASPLSY